MSLDTYLHRSQPHLDDGKRHPTETRGRMYFRYDRERGRYAIMVRHIGSLDPAQDGRVEVERLFYHDMRPWSDMRGQIPPVAAALERVDGIKVNWQEVYGG